MRERRAWLLWILLYVAVFVVTWEALDLAFTLGQLTGTGE